MTIEIRIANNNEAKMWDNIISRSHQATIFHQWDWLKIAEKHTQSKLYPLIGFKDTTPVGAFPLFFQKNGPLRLVFSPPPRTVLFYLGPVLFGYDSLIQEKRENTYFGFMNSVEQFIETELKPNYISISLPPALQDPRPFTWNGYNIELLYDYEIDLTKGIDNLFQSIDKKQRQDINRANKKGIYVELGGKKELNKIIDLLIFRYQQQGKRTSINRKYLLDIYDKFNENFVIFITKYEDEILTGLIHLKYNDSLYSWIGNPRPRISISPSPNDLMAWEAIKYGCENDFLKYVIMSAAGNKRLHNYYSAKFNPKLLIRFSAKKIQ